MEATAKQKPLLDSDEKEPPSRELECSLCCGLLVEAVTLQCAHSICRVCWELWSSASKGKKRCESRGTRRQNIKTCPSCRTKIQQEPCRTMAIDDAVCKIVARLPRHEQEQYAERVRLLQLAQPPQSLRIKINAMQPACKTASPPLTDKDLLELAGVVVRKCRSDPTNCRLTSAEATLGGEPCSELICWPFVMSAAPAAAAAAVAATGPCTCEGKLAHLFAGACSGAINKIIGVTSGGRRSCQFKSKVGKPCRFGSHPSPDEVKVSQRILLT
jgi:hypothetical protein